MNRAEKFVLNSGPRRLLQRHYEAPLLQRLGGRIEGGHVLEVGCGAGGGTPLIFDQFGAASVDAIDLDPDQVQLCQRRLARCELPTLTISQGDVTALHAQDATYDAVFDVGILHHVPVWQDGVAEIARVLKPGGIFYFEEVTQHALDRWSFRLLFEHPRDNRFTGWQFTDELLRHGFELTQPPVHRIQGDYVFGAARFTG